MTQYFGFGLGGTELPRQQGGVPGFSAAALMDTSSAEMVSIVGRVRHPTATSFSIRKPHFSLGAVTFTAASSTFTVSLQGISATGPPYQPDGTILGVGNSAFGTTTTLTANAANSTGNFATDYPSSNGEFLAVVFNNSFTAGDSIVVRMMDPTAAPQTENSGGSGLLNTSGTWNLVTNAAPGIVVFECADGSYAFLEECYPYSALSSVSITTNNAAGVAFTVAEACYINMFELWLLIPNGCDGDLILYDGDGTTPLVTQPIDNDNVLAATARMTRAVFAPIALSAATTYRAVFVTSTATAATLYFGDVAAAGMLASTPGGAEAHYTVRSAGTWTETATRKPHWGFRLSSNVSSGGVTNRPSADRIMAGF